MEQAVGVQVEFHVGIDAMAFNYPGGALGIPAAKLRLRDHATVAEWLVTANTDPAAPGARADDGAKLELFESQREGFAIAATLPVDEGRHMAAEST